MSSLLIGNDFQRVGPGCLTCGRPINDVAIKSEPGHNKVAEVLLRCHGAEELIEVDLGSEHWTYQECGEVIRHKWYFDPKQVASVAEER